MDMGKSLDLAITQGQVYTDTTLTHETSVAYDNVSRAPLLSLYLYCTIVTIISYIYFPLNWTHPYAPYGRFQIPGEKNLLAIRSLAPSVSTLQLQRSDRYDISFQPQNQLGCVCGSWFSR